MIRLSHQSSFGGPPFPAVAARTEEVTPLVKPVVRGDDERHTFVEKCMKGLSSLVHDLSLRVSSRNFAKT